MRCDCDAGGLMCQHDDELRRELSELLALLVFDEMAAVQEWFSDSFFIFSYKF